MVRLSLNFGSVLWSGRKKTLPGEAQDASDALGPPGVAPAPSSGQAFTTRAMALARRSYLGRSRQADPPMASAAAVDAADSTGASAATAARPSVELPPVSAQHLAVLKRLDRSAKPWVIHPHHASVQRWNSLLAVLLMVQAIVLPLQIAYVPDEDMVKLPWLMWFGCWVDCVLWLDVVLQFFLQVPSLDRSHWICDMGVIAKRYIKGSFVVDVVSLLPLRRVLARNARVSARDRVLRQFVIRMVGFHQLLRFSRMPRVWRLLKEKDSVVSTTLQLTYVQNTLLTSSIMVLFTIHVMACVWASMAINADPRDRTWFDYYAAGKLSNAEFYKPLQPASVYLCSLYWAVFTITGIGYGDIVPVEPVEYCIAILCMFVGAVTWAWVVASIVSVMEMTNQVAKQHLQTLDCINEIFRDNTVKVRLGRNLREYFTKFKTVREHEVSDGLIEHLSPELRLEVVYVVHKNLIDAVWWLKNIPIQCQFMVDLTQSMGGVLYSPTEFVPNRRELCIIRQGLCIHGGALLSKGQVFGLDMLLDNEALRKPHATLCLTFLHLSVLTSQQFKRALDDHPEVQPYIRKSHVTFLVMRGIIYKARLSRRKYASGGERLSASNPIRVCDPAVVTKPFGDVEDVLGGFLHGGQSRCEFDSSDMDPSNPGIAPRASTRLSRLPGGKVWPNRASQRPASTLRATVADMRHLTEKVEAAEVRLGDRMRNLEAMTTLLANQVRQLNEI